MRNKILLNFNQDENIGRPAYPYKWGYNDDWTFDSEHPAEFWSGPSSNGTLVLMINTEDDSSDRTAVWDEIPELQGHDCYRITDVWTGEDLGEYTDEYTASDLESHDTAVILVTGEC